MAKIAAKIASFTGEDERQARLKEQFTFLQKMAEAKSAEFKSQMTEMYTAGNGKEGSEVTGNRAISYYSAQHVDLTSSCNDAIDSSIDSFFQGKSGIKDGFQKLVKCSLATMINNTAYGEYKEDLFLIYPENNAIVRLDCKAYKYTFQQTGFIQECQNIFCYTMAKSVVDHSKLTKDELLYFVTQMCGQEEEKGISEQVKLAEVQKFLQELISVWNILEDEVDKSSKTRMFRNSIESENKVSMNEIESIFKMNERNA